jgi:hypothetical protein
MKRISTIAIATVLLAGYCHSVKASGINGFPSLSYTGGYNVGPEIYLIYNGTTLSIVGSAGVGAYGLTAYADQGPYDAVEDTYLGVVNQSSKSINSINLNGGTLDIFGFDGDGYDVAAGIAANAKDTSWGGYGGPAGYFTGISGNTGTVDFIGGVAPNGGIAYFTLEENIVGAGGLSTSGGGLTGNVPDAGSTMSLLGGVLVGLGALRRRFNV